MKLKELGQRCGECKCTGYCAEPFEDLCLCCDSRFAEMDDEEYKKKANEISICSDKREDETLNEYIARKVYEPYRKEDCNE